MDFTLFSMKIAASCTVALGGTVATVGFPDIGLQGFAPKLAGINAKTQRINGFCLAPLRLCAFALKNSSAAVLVLVH